MAAQHMRFRSHDGRKYPITRRHRAAGTSAVGFQAAGYRRVATVGPARLRDAGYAWQEGSSMVQPASARGREEQLLKVIDELFGAVDNDDVVETAERERREEQARGESLRRHLELVFHDLDV